MASKNRVIKTADEEAEISCVVGRGKLREEVWQDTTGKVVRYNLAFINHLMYWGDNGRVLGYDVAHARHVLLHSTGFPNWRSGKEPLQIRFTPGEKYGYPAKATTINICNPW